MLQPSLMKVKGSLPLWRWVCISCCSPSCKQRFSLCSLHFSPLFAGSIKDLVVAPAHLVLPHSKAAFVLFTHKELLQRTTERNTHHPAACVGRQIMSALNDPSQGSQEWYNAQQRCETSFLYLQLSPCTCALNSLDPCTSCVSWWVYTFSVCHTVVEGLWNLSISLSQRHSFRSKLLYAPASKCAKVKL